MDKAAVAGKPIGRDLKRSGWRRVRRVAVAVLVCYVGLVLVAMIFQRRLIYFPTKLDPNLVGLRASREGLLPWRNGHRQIIGWKLSANGPAAGSVLIVHGNAGCAIDRVYFAKPIHDAAAFDVFILEYPGYGAREGSPGERSFYAAAEDAFESLPVRGSKFIVSESIGAGVAAHLAAKHGPQIDGMIFFAPYDDFVSVAQSKMPLLPVRLVLWDRYNPTKWLEEYRGPVVMVLAGADEVIPLESGRRFCDAYKGPKQTQIVPDATHNTIQEQSSDWWKEVIAFWEQNQQTTPKSP
jgi:pimeloyl-ACP methyl ester carboxylesterase